ncbi:hypothetical protein IF1G_00073 [Cordyceps javanica]|uniref:Uncharacterized protein n=1 Tax=Cordyceps javanica TaxID=43265 RepID=A0A545VEJ4_9HYPO|nr:hypothetical protein IF1G_00073 [Cordyceps javanica]
MQNAAEETNAFRHSPLARPIAIVHRQIDTLTRPVTAFLDSFIHADGLRNFVSATSNGMPCLASKRSSFPFSINCARYRFLELFPTTSRPGLHLAAAREAVLRHAKYGLLTGQRDNMTARWIEQLSPSFSHCAQKKKRVRNSTVASPKRHPVRRALFYAAASPMYFQPLSLCSTSTYPHCSITRAGAK